ncbi:cation transport protein-domain-containing protein [Aspergillus keveii]|uniref:Potassium transport protein n=1 Tax=Aspergillus keveii TaxID=714993 RepID=A0ABR4FIN6_9EURO
MLPAIPCSALKLKSRILCLKDLHLNFILIHYIYIISTILITSIIIYPGSDLKYIDALFFSAGAATQSGLNTVDFNLLHTYQQVILYCVTMLTTPIFIHTAVVFIRLYWFEKRFQHVVRNARSLRSTRSRPQTINEDGHLHFHSQGGSGINGRPIVVLHSTRERGTSGNLPKPPEESYSHSISPTSSASSAPHPERNKAHLNTAVNHDFGNLPIPQLSPGHHIAFLEKQRKDRGALRIPSPRDYDRGDAKEEGDPSPLAQPLTRKPTFTGVFRSLTQEKGRPTLPYLSWDATVGRNSNFIDLTEEQRNELGGIEYRSLKTLAVVLILYYGLFHIFGIICLAPWIMETHWGEVVKEAGQGRPWWAIFIAGSAFNDLGFAITPDSMISFQTAIFPLLLMTFLIIIGNTGFPCMLRLIIWAMSKVVSKQTPLWEELNFLLDHPRRCFTLLFPRNATWLLFAILVLLNGIDLLFFIILDLNDPTVTRLSTRVKIVAGLFQASCTRTAGFSAVSLSELHPAVQVSYMIMMYISVFPIAISMRRTNVYEEQSLGVYDIAEDINDENKTAPSYIGTHLRKQLSFDLWYVFLGLFIITIVEGDRLEDTSEYAFQIWAVLFEVVSAYGTVGLSLGYPGVNASFVSQFKVISVLVIIAMQIRGRHRGLPYSLDRAILLPSESLDQEEIVDTETRMRRRTSNLSQTPAMGHHESQPFSRNALNSVMEGRERVSGLNFTNNPVIRRQSTRGSQKSQQ